MPDAKKTDSCDLTAPYIVIRRRRLASSFRYDGPPLPFCKAAWTIMRFALATLRAQAVTVEAQLQRDIGRSVARSVREMREKANQA